MSERAEKILKNISEIRTCEQYATVYFVDSSAKKLGRDWVVVTKKDLEETYTKVKSISQAKWIVIQYSNRKILKESHYKSAMQAAL